MRLSGAAVGVTRNGFRLLGRGAGLGGNKNRDRNRTGTSVLGTTDFKSNILFYLNYNYLIMLKVMPAQIHHLQPNRV